MFVMDYYGHKLSNGVLFAHHLILDVPGGSSHLGYRRRVPPGHNPPTRVKVNRWWYIKKLFCLIGPIGRSYFNSLTLLALLVLSL